MAWEGQWVSTRRRVVYQVKRLTISVDAFDLTSFFFRLSSLHSSSRSAVAVVYEPGVLVSAISSWFSGFLIVVVVVVRLAAVAGDEPWVSYVACRYLSIHLIFLCSTACDRRRISSLLVSPSLMVDRRPRRAN